MWAVVHDTYGSADVLHLARVARSAVSEEEVLLRVHAAGLDRGAWHLMTGRPYLLRLGSGLRAPRNPILGREVAGAVFAVGSAVSRFSAGDEVFGIARGSFAEYAAANEDKLARKPGNLSFEQAAVVAVSALTALQALCDVGRVEAGQQVLIVGASGGVGSYAVQLDKAFGAEVTGVCSTTKLDLILDIGGNQALSRLRRALTPTGTAVIVGGEEGGCFSGGMNRQLRALTLSPFVGRRLTMVLCRERASDLERLTDLIEAGRVAPSIDTTYPLDRVPEAVRHLEAGKARGKVAITI